MRIALLALSVASLGCSYSGYEPEYRALKEEAAKSTAWTPSPAGSSSEIEPRLLRLLEPESFPDFSRGLAFDEAIRIGLVRNPRLRAAVKGLEAAVERVPQAASLPDPELELSITVESFFRGLLEIMGKLMQPLLFPGKLEASARVALEEAWERWRDVQEQALEVRSSVARNCAELHTRDHALRIAQENRTLLEQLESAARSLFEARKVPQQDVLKVRLRSHELEREILRITRERREAEARLNALLGRGDMAAVGTVQLPTEPREPEGFDALVARAWQQRPELAGMNHRLRGSLALLRLAELNSWPDFKPGAEYRWTQDSADEIELGLGITLPFLRTGRREAAMEQARALLGESWHLYERSRIEIAQEVAAAHARVRETHEALALYRDKLRPQSQQTYQAALADYRAGEVDFLTTIDALLDFQEIENDYYRLLGEHWTAWEDLRRAVGGF